MIDRKAEAERRKIEVAEQADRIKRAKAAHQRAVELVKEATRTGRGAAAADVAWREAKAELLELETGKRPAWAARPVEPTDSTESSDSAEAADESDTGDGDMDGD